MTSAAGDRKKRLARLLGGRRLGIVLSDHTDDDGATIFRDACRMGLEGIVEAADGTLSVGAFAGLAQGEEPGQPGDDPGAGSGVVGFGLLDVCFHQLRTLSQSGVGQKRAKGRQQLSAGLCWDTCSSRGTQCILNDRTTVSPGIRPVIGNRSAKISTARHTSVLSITVHASLDRSTKSPVASGSFKPIL
jgi:hypothetical protein